MGFLSWQDGFLVNYFYSVFSGFSSSFFFFFNCKLFKYLKKYK
jgi:hypothetical protein